MFKRSYGRNHNYSGRFKPRKPAFYIKKFLRAEVRAETGFRNGIIAEFHSHFCREYGIAPVCNIGERSAVHQSGRSLKSLHKIGL